jgi:hypothetical protein
VIWGIVEVPGLPIPLVWDWSMIARVQRLGTRCHSAHEDCWARYMAHQTQTIDPASNQYFMAQDTRYGAHNRRIYNGRFFLPAILFCAQ